MTRTYNALSCLGAACAMAVTIACGAGSPAGPAAPAAAPGTQDANADGSTLKVSAPTLSTPIGDTRTDTRTPALVANVTTGLYANRAFSYEFELMNDASNRIGGTTITATGSTVTWNYPTELERDTPYRWRVRATLDGRVGPWSSPGRFVTIRENRTPNPPPGQRLPLPNMVHIVNQVIRDNPGILSPSRSCQDPDHGGNAVTGWEFLDKTIDALRLTDTRWGYNGKRGNAADPSQDIVAYNYGRQPDEGTTDVYIIDVLLSHCGSGAAATWIDQTQVTFDSGTIGRWTSRGRFPGSSGVN
jgi:hypothetical protein